MVRSRAFFASVFGFLVFLDSFLPIAAEDLFLPFLRLSKTIIRVLYFSEHICPAGLDCPSIAAAPRLHMIRMRL